MVTLTSIDDDEGTKMTIDVKKCQMISIEKIEADKISTLNVDMGRGAKTNLTNKKRSKFDKSRPENLLIN